MTIKEQVQAAIETVNEENLDQSGEKRVEDNPYFDLMETDLFCEVNP